MAVAAANGPVLPEAARPLPVSLGGLRHGGFVPATEDTEGFHQLCKIVQGSADVASQVLMMTSQAMPGAALGNLGRAIDSFRRLLQMRYIIGSIQGLGQDGVAAAQHARGRELVADRGELAMSFITNLAYTAYGATDTAVWLTEINVCSLGDAAAAMGTANGVLFCVAAGFEAGCDGYQLRKEGRLEADLRNAVTDLEAQLGGADGVAAIKERVDAVMTAYRAPIQAAIDARKQAMGGDAGVRADQRRVDAAIKAYKDHLTPAIQAATVAMGGRRVEASYELQVAQERAAAVREGREPVIPAVPGAIQAVRALRAQRDDRAAALAWAAQQNPAGNIFQTAVNLEVLQQLESSLKNEQLAMVNRDAESQQEWRELRTLENLKTVHGRVKKDERVLILNIIKNLCLIAGMAGGLIAYRNKYYFAVLTVVSGSLGFYRIFTKGTLGAVKERARDAIAHLEAVRPMIQVQGG